jgi:hypothetical protein
MRQQDDIGRHLGANQVRVVFQTRGGWPIRIDILRRHHDRGLVVRDGRAAVRHDVEGALDGNQPHFGTVPVTCPGPLGRERRSIVELPHRSPAVN